jgi:hypothetical protein
MNAGKQRLIPNKSGRFGNSCACRPDNSAGNAFVIAPEYALYVMEGAAQVSQPGVAMGCQMPVFG